MRVVVAVRPVDALHAGEVALEDEGVELLVDDREPVPRAEDGQVLEGAAEHVAGLGGGDLVADGVGGHLVVAA